MSTFGSLNEADLQDRIRDNFSLTYSQLCTLVTLAMFHNLTGLPMLRETIDLVVWKKEGRGANHALLELERKGFAEHGPWLKQTATWRITVRGAARVLMWLTAELDSRPGIVSATEIEELERVAS